MTDRAMIEELLARVEAATGEDRELEIAIYLACGWTLEKREARGAFFGKRRENAAADGKRWLYAPDGRRLNTNPSGADPAPEITRTVDASVALFRETLPGWWWSAGDCEREKHATLGPELHLGLSVDIAEGFAATVPLAICAALLKALINKGVQ